ncbi:hypothetical protein LPJ74_001683 [Coemansia sp. RSA 1843]|nr:hypothetical protein LPJ74_001683 [Coemansia sp. RSA 1843]
MDSSCLNTKPDIQQQDPQWQEQSKNYHSIRTLDQRHDNSSFVVRQGRLVSTVTMPPPKHAQQDDHDRPPLLVSVTSVSRYQRKRILSRVLRIGTNEPKKITVSSYSQQLVAKALRAFLPADYKNSVTPEYLSYAKWQFVHNVLGSASGVLATQAMLYAMGLGSGALPLSAAINWVIKDGFGQFGGVVYATMVGQKFDSDPKHLRFWSAVWLQTATWLEMLTPLFPHLFLVIGSVANIGKNISWLAMSATKASINKTFCLKENLGDLTAKHGSQSTAAGLIGTAFGILIGATADISVYTLILGFVPISIASLWGNYRSLLYTITPTLNVERSRLMLKDAITHSTDGQLIFSPELLKTPRQVSAVERFMREISHVEPRGLRPGIVVSPKLDRLHHDVRLCRGTESVQVCVSRMVNSAFKPAVNGANKRYYVGYLPQSTINGASNGNLYLWFSTRAGNRNTLLGVYHASVLQELICSHATRSGSQVSDPAVIADLEGKAREFVKYTADVFCDSVVQQGWDVTTMYFSKRSDLVEVEAI